MAPQLLSLVARDATPEEGALSQKKLTPCAVLSSQWFAPTELVISFETEGQGKFTQAEIDKLVVRDASGRVVALDLPRKTVLIANHQVRPPPSYQTHFGSNVLTESWSCTPAGTPDLRRLVVRLDAHVPRGHAQGRIHRPEE